MVKNHAITPFFEMSNHEFRKLFDTNYSGLCTYVYRLSGDLELSEDIVQTIFIKLWKKRNSLYIEKSVESYLYRSCHNQYLKHLRQSKVAISRLDEFKYESLYQLQEEEIQKWQEEKIAAVKVAVNQLPPKCKEAFILHKFKQVKYKDIAVIMGISIKTVENHISKALSYVRKTVSFP